MATLTTTLLLPLPLVGTRASHYPRRLSSSSSFLVSPLSLSTSASDEGLNLDHFGKSSSSSIRRGSPFPCRAGSSYGGLSPSGALTPELKEALDKFVTSHKVVAFIKGTKMFPQCGFSNTVVQILNSLNVPFEAVNILEDDALRLGLKDYSNWPTFPQVYIGGEFFGGCDITLEAYQSGELQEYLEKAMCS